LDGRCNANTRELAAEISFTIAPVPSGDPSSTINMSIRGSFDSTESISGRMFSRSL
jgi:hypothetical protein